MSCTEEPGHMWQDTPMSCNEDDQVLRRMERSRSPQLPMHSRLWVPEIGVSGHKGTGDRSLRPQGSGDRSLRHMGQYSAITSEWY